MKELARKYAVLRALKDRVRDVEQEISTEFLSALDIGDVKAASLDDGTLLGKITKAHGKRTPTVTDEAALIEWVRRTHPSEIVETVRPAYRSRLLASAGRHGDAVDETTGEIVPGIELRVGDPYVSFRSQPGLSEIVAAHWDALAAEAVFHLPHGH